MMQRGELVTKLDVHEDSPNIRVIGYTQMCQDHLARDRLGIG